MTMTTLVTGHPPPVDSAADADADADADVGPDAATDAEWEK